MSELNNEREIINLVMSFMVSNNISFYDKEAVPLKKILSEQLEWLDKESII